MGYPKSRLLYLDGLTSTASSTLGQGKAYIFDVMMSSHGFTVISFTVKLKCKPRPAKDQALHHWTGPQIPTLILRYHGCKSEGSPAGRPLSMSVSMAERESSQSLLLPQVPWPQVVLFGDSLFQASTQILDGFAFHAALQNRTHTAPGSAYPVPCENHP